MPVVVDLYARVSTDTQVEEGYSLAEQERLLRSYADAMSWTVHAFYQDGGFSGKSLERPGMQSVIDDCKAGRVQKVVTYKLDRLSRSLRDTLYLIEDIFQPNGVDYVSITENFDCGSPIGKLILSVLSSFSQLERENIRSRMSMGRSASVRSGHWRGGCGLPLGYRYIPKTATEPGRLVQEPYEALAVRRMYELFLQGMTFSGIVEQVREEYPLPGRGKKNTSGFVKGILSNRIYIGQQSFKGEYYKVTEDCIIDEATFWAVQNKLAEYQTELDNKLRKPRHRGHLLTGFTWCGCCGARACYKDRTYQTKRGMTAYGKYVCWAKDRDAKACTKSKGISSRALEDAVLSQVEQIRFEDIVRSKADESSDTSAIQSRIDAIATQQAKLVDVYTLGTIPLEILQKRSAELSAEREKLVKALDDARRLTGEQNTSAIVNALGQVDHIREMTEEQQRDILRALIKRITLYPDSSIDIQWNI